MSIPVSKLVEVAQNREAKQGGNQLKNKTFFAESLGKKGRAASGFCIPPSIKARLLTGIRSDLKSKASSFKVSKDDGKKATHLQSMAKRIATANRLIHNVKTCDAENSKELENEIKLVLDQMSDEEIVEAIDKMRGVEFQTKEQSRVDREAKLKAEGKDPSIPSLNQFIKNIYQKTSEGLIWTAYDGLKEETDNPPISPCGIKLNLGEGTDAIQRALDRMAFYGSKDDWVEFYVNGNKSHINQNGTFEPLSQNDWAGCVKDIYENEVQLTPQDVEDIANDVGLEGSLFDFERMMKAGYHV